MAYEEYDYYNEPAGEGKSVKESLREILNGLQDRTKLREAGISLKEALQLTPNVTESLGRGGVAQAIGTSGDLRDLSNTINSYLPKSVRNFTRAAEFLANPYATAIQQTAPTTEETLDFVPRVTDKYQGYKQHETLGEFVAPSLGYFGGKTVKALKDAPIGLSIMGPESKLWNKEMAFTAGKLEAKGNTPDEILEKTGMVRGLDGQWRSELSDQFSKLKGEGDTFGTRHGNVHPSNNRYTTPERRAQGVLVEDILHHPELLEAYPDLAKIKVEAHGSTRGEKGSYRQSKNTISIREDLSPEEARSTLLHELTHGVQGIESMNRGANYGQLVQHFEKQKQNIMSQIENLNTVRNAAFRNNDMEKYRINTEKRDALTKQYLDMNPEELGYEAYRNHAGEAEARMVQARMDLTPEQLRKQFPYQYTGKEGTGLDINPDQAIVTTKQPGTINMPEQSIELPQSEIDELGFHSPLENAILKIGQPKGTGDQFLKQLEKTPGVKTEELDVSGVKQYLLDHPNVTKQELLDYMKENRLKLEQKVLGEPTHDIYDDYRIQGGETYHDEDYIKSLAEDTYHDMINESDIVRQEKEAIAEQFPEEYANYKNDPEIKHKLQLHVEDALFDQAKQAAHDMYYENPINRYYDDLGYEIYGNDDSGYSFKDPHGNFLDIGNGNDIYDLGNAEAALRNYHLEGGNLDLESAGGAKFEDYVLPGNYTNYREVLTTLPPQKSNYSNLIRELTDEDKARLGVNEGVLAKVKDTWGYYSNREMAEMQLSSRLPKYESSHFDEPNILAHTRLNDRIINGKKTLMVEEIQSDWHQAGRRKGYQGTAEKDYDNYIKDLEKRYENEAFNIAVNEGLAKDKAKTLATKMKNKMAEDPRKLAEYFGESEKQMAMNEARVNSRSRVPDAPFKKNWHELMMKQILNEAVKGDYDAIAFTTGKQQADRYSLSKQINELSYNPETKQLWAYKDGYSSPVVSKIVPEEDLPDLIGKEAAKKLLDTKLTTYLSDKGETLHHQLTGQDLDVGGEGMKGFYDKILPDFVNKYTKKYGMGVKKAKLSHNASSLSTAEIENGLKEQGYTMEEYLNMKPAEKMEIFNQIPGADVHFVELSDAAKKDIKSKGQPLFSGIGLAAPPLLMDNEEDN